MNQVQVVTKNDKVVAWHPVVPEIKATGTDETEAIDELRFDLGELKLEIIQSNI